MSSEKYTPLVSVIVPCYNYGLYLTECLQSVQTQSFTDWECIIVDNGSTDQTAEVANSFCKANKRFKYLHTEQNGVSFARNTGIRNSSGRLILPLDADDKLEPLFLEKTTREMQTRPELTLVYCNARLFGASSGKWELPEYSFKDLLIENSIFCTALFKRSDYEVTSGYNENMKEGFEDWDFWISLLKNGGKVSRLPDILFNYRIRSQSRNHKLDQERQLKLRRQVYENHRQTYDQYFDMPQLLFENYGLSNELNRLKRSRALKLGQFLLRPLLFFRDTLKKSR